MRKTTAFLFALVGTLLLVLLFVGGRLLYIGHHTTSYDKIAGEGAPAALTLRENQVTLKTITDPVQIRAFTDVLASYTYTEYPHFFAPDEKTLIASRVTVAFDETHSIGADADGNVFVNGKLRDVENSEGESLYRQLYQLLHANAV